jgi:hypothetical protein
MQQMGRRWKSTRHSIDVTDPTIMKALHGDGKTPMTLYQFHAALKPTRWGKTDNAKKPRTTWSRKSGQDWGFTK